MHYFKYFSRKAGLDTSVIYTISSRIVQIFGSVLTLLLITKFLNTHEQGYYYTFGSILSIQIFFELGLTGIITQYVAHEFAHLKWKNNLELDGDDYHKSRLVSIVKLGIIWVLCIAVVLFFVFLLAGQLFFLKYNNHLQVDWQIPWMVLSVGTSLLVVVNLIFALLEGLGKIKEVTKLRLLHHTLQLLFLTLLFITQFKLLAGGLALLISVMITVIVIFASGNMKVILSLCRNKTTLKINYRTEILPFQLKIALGSISGYLIYQLLNPVLFATQGATIAGQMGATQTVLNGILIVSLSWFSTKVAFFSTLVARLKYRMLNLSYRKNLSLTVSVSLIGTLAFITAVVLLKHFKYDMGNRFLDIAPIILLALTQLTNVIGHAQAYYLRSFKKEPFFISSIVIGLLSGTATLICAHFFTITEMTFAYFLINGGIGFIWGCIIFRKNIYGWTNIKNWF